MYARHVTVQTVFTRMKDFQFLIGGCRVKKQT